MNRARIALGTTWAVAAVFCATVAATAEDWSQWLGPDRDGRSATTGFADEWTTVAPSVAWERPLGNGFSGIAASGDRIYTMFSDGVREFIVCLRASDGQEIWRADVGSPFPDSQGGPGPRSTPTVMDSTLFALGSHGRLMALSTSDGSMRWSHDLVQQYGGRIPRWGYSQSPLVREGLVFLDVGGEPDRGLMAFDARSGAVRWASGNELAGYSAPIWANLASQSQILFFTASAVVAVVPETGDRLWEIPWPTRYGVNAATPIVLPGSRIFLSSGYGMGCGLYRIDRDGGMLMPTPLWRNRRMKNKMTTSVVHDGHLYGFNEERLVCLDVETGQRQWSHADLGRGNLLYVDEHLLVLAESGDLVWIEASSRSFVERGRLRVLETTAWTVPSIHRGRAYLRDTEKLVCVNLPTDGATAP